MKKGQDVVDTNHRAIDAGATAYVKIDVPAAWADAADKAETVELAGKPELVKMVSSIMEPVGRMDGDSLPVSAFTDHVDGQFELGASAYEKRGIAVTVPTWDASTCIQCNQCALVCPHATIRPFALTEEEAAAAPEKTTLIPAKGKAAAGLQYTLAISPLDCMGCNVCVVQCPTNSLSMAPAEGELVQQEVFDYCVAEVSDKPEIQDATVKGSQFKQPPARVLRRMCGLRSELRMPVWSPSCSAIACTFPMQRVALRSWGGPPAATSPYTVNKEGRGPAWANSVRGQAEHGLGMLLGQNAVREKLVAETEQLLENGADEALANAANAWLNERDKAEESKAAADAYVAELERVIAQGAANADLAKSILADKDYLAKKSIWIFGGDGWAYDIGYGGLDHVLASGEDVNVFVFDTEVYSNTGGQASKASNIGQVAQFAAAGKDIKKKSLVKSPLRTAMSMSPRSPWAPSLRS